MNQSNRWNTYVLERGEGFDRFWSHHLNNGRERRLLFILAKGFDPRMCSGLERILSLQSKGTCDVALIEFSESPGSSSWSYQSLVTRNMERLAILMKGRGNVRVLPLAMRSPDGRRIASPSALNLFKKREELEPYTDVILDISSAPRGVYLPLLSKILHLLDHGKAKEKSPLNFHLLAWEDIELDARIRDNGVEEKADYLSPFRGGMDREATAVQPRVWIPLLGEGQNIQLERIYVHVAPDEISPVLPSPARNPRRADDLVVSYHYMLFDSWGIEPKNFIYASEQNPFEVYRQIVRAICAYRDSFVPLGGAKFVLSALSSKLLSVAALLVAYDFKCTGFDVGIAHVDCHGYDFVEPDAPSGGELFGLWLAGEWEAIPVKPAKCDNG